MRDYDFKEKPIGKAGWWLVLLMGIAVTANVCRSGDTQHPVTVEGRDSLTTTIRLK